MFRLPLHAGIEHPSLVIVTVSSILTFLAGLWLAMTSRGVRERLQVLGRTAPRTGTRPER
jgi:hypothetical protein